MITTYTSDFSRDTIFDISVAAGATEVVTSYVSATFTPASGISAVELTTADIIGEDRAWGVVGTNEGAFPVTLLNDGTGVSQILYVSAEYTNTNNAALFIDDNLGYRFSFGVAELSAGSVDTLGSPGSAAQSEDWGLTGSLTAVSVNPNYTVDASMASLNTSVPYGTSATDVGTCTWTASSIQGLETGLSSVSVDIYLSGSDTSKFSAISSNVALPTELTLGAGRTIGIATIFNNDYLHASNETFTVVAVASTSNAQLSANWDGVFSQATDSWSSAEYTLTALGDAGAPSGVSAFTATAGQERVRISWVNPSDSDLSAVRVNYATGATAPANQSAGTQLYQGIGTSVEQTSLTAGQAMSYSIFSLDNVGNWSSLTTDTCATATPFAVSQYGLSSRWPYLTNAEIRRKLLEEGII